MAGLNQRSVTREVPKLTLDARFVPASVDVAARTVDITWTTGAAVLRGGGYYSDPYYEELSLDPKHVRMERLKSGAAPFLNTHRSYDIDDVLGVIQTASLSKSEGVANVRIAKGIVGDDVLSKIADGILRNISVGYRTYETQQVTGGDAAIDRFLAIDWEPYEISLVPMGADAGAVTRSAGDSNACKFHYEERVMADTTATPSPIVPVTAPVPVPAPTIAAPIADEARDAAVRDAERERVLGIQRAGMALQRPEAEIAAACRNGTSLDAYRAAAVDALAAAPAEGGGPLSFDRRDPRIEAGADERDKFIARSENWLLHRSGSAKVVAEAATKAGKKVDLDPGDSRGLSLIEMARECLTRVGVSTRGMDVLKMVGLAFTHRGAGTNSSSDFPVILENTMNKTLLGSYGITPDTWRSICVEGVLNDFRQHNRYRQGSFGVLATVLPGAEYQNMSIPDGEKQTIIGATKGKMIAVTRETIINDDMGALVDMASRLGRSVALTIEQDFYAFLLSNPVMSDGLALFHASHGNIGASGAALTIATIEADRILMGQQQDVTKNEYLELRPSILLVPLGLGGYAKVLNNAQYDVDVKANARNQEPNKVVGLYDQVIDTNRLTGTTRYSFANPAIAPTFEVAFVNGVSVPYMEMQQGWRIDGVEWKVRIDYGIGARDWRGVVRNPGA